jgi:hypothetical protein
MQTGGQVRYDPLMSELLQEMTRQPTAHELRPWHLSYIPPRHLRLPGFAYGDIDESPEVAERMQASMNPADQGSKMETCAGVGAKRRDAITQEAVRLVRNASQGDIEAASATHQNPLHVDMWSCAGSYKVAPIEGNLNKMEVLRI